MNTNTTCLTGNTRKRGVIDWWFSNNNWKCLPWGRGWKHLPNGHEDRGRYLHPPYTNVENVSVALSCISCIYYLLLSRSESFLNIEKIQYFYNYTNHVDYRAISCLVL